MTNDKLEQVADPSGWSTCDSSCEYSPRTDVIETADEYRVEVELPGVRPDDVDVDLESGILRVQGKVAPQEESGLRVRVREFGSGDFVRTLRLGDSIDAGKISAKTKDGLLTLHLPKKGALIPRTIPVVISAN